VGYPELVYKGAFSAIEAEEIAVIYCVQNNAFYTTYNQSSDSIWPILDENVFIVFKHLPERLAPGQITAVGLNQKNTVCHRL